VISRDRFCLPEPAALRKQNQHREKGHLYIRETALNLRWLGNTFVLVIHSIGTQNNQIDYTPQFLLRRSAWGYLRASVFVLKAIPHGVAVSTMSINMTLAGTPTAWG
jgi:hypothetical protein